MKMRYVLLLLLAAPLLAQNSLYLDLSGPWRLETSDNPRFAEPGLDDSRWRTLTVPIPDERGATQPIPGVSTAYWLRRRVELPPGTDRTRLALTLGAIRDGYQLYVNGELVATTDGFDDARQARLPQPRTFALPPVDGPSLQLALRVHQNRVIPSVWRLADQGPYLLGYQDQLPVDPAPAQFQERYRERSLGLVFGAILLTIAGLTFLAWTIDRGRRELLWFAAAALARACTEFLHLSQLKVDAQPMDRSGVATFQVVLELSTWPLLGLFAVASFAPSLSAWWRTAFWLSFGLTPLASFGSWYLHRSALLLGCLVLLIVLVCWYGRGAKADSLEARSTLVAIAILAVLQVENSARRLVGVDHWLPRLFPAGSYQVSRDQVIFTVLALVILVSLLRRIAADRREKQRLANEFEAARVIQRLLLDRAQLSEPGFALEAVYAPAQEVGGDFYYVLDGQTVVVGDVSGKGLKAAMLVSLAIGSLRAIPDRRPGPLLSALSRAVAGQMEGGGFITCCCARLGANGELTIANAGHLAPYLDGAEATVDTGLPLGLVPDAAYGETVVALRPGGCLTLLSDGVVEAENAQRELFGFDRTREISTKSAQEIAEAAKAWGQNDDITVVTIRRSESTQGNTKQ